MSYVILWCFLNERETCFKESQHAFLMVNRHYFIQISVCKHNSNRTFTKYKQLTVTHSVIVNLIYIVRNNNF